MSLTAVEKKYKLIPSATKKIKNKTLKLQQSYNNNFCFCYGRIMLNNSRTTLYFHG